jgi:hypothetical protein
MKIFLSKKPIGKRPQNVAFCPYSQQTNYSVVVFSAIADSKNQIGSCSLFCFVGEKGN